ncbi:MAG: ureidoglycolate lyase [Pseudonocardiales bacterium]|nr:MAG: ureidoglycolate lyase [Pseudonocardiales bacterium]
MKLARVGERGSERAVVVVSPDQYVDVSAVVGDFDEKFFGSGGLASLASTVDQCSDRRFDLGKVRVGAPIARPHQILCIGLNYADHAAESGQPVPSEPIVFTKSPNTLIGPDDDVHVPRGATKMDWEVELGVVVGRRCRYLPDEGAAREAIAGYLVVNDVSERAFQLERGGQWHKGKSAETFNPAGPYLVTADTVHDINSLDLWLNVNGVRRQSGSTKTMLFSPSFIVHYLSQFMVLEPGDLINTGTPPGVGMGFRPPIWLQPGDVMELGVEGLGSQRQHVVAAP